MLATWLCAFLFSVVLARVKSWPWVIDWAQWPALLGLLVLMVCVSQCLQGRRRRLVRHVFAAVAGIFWGFGHSAPIPNTNLDDVVVVKTSVRDTVSGAVIVKSGQDYFEVSGEQRLGGIGSVRAMSSVRLFGDSRAVLKMRGPEDLPDDLFGQIRDTIRVFFRQRMEVLTPFYRRWLAGLILGENTELPPDVRQAFKRTGLYHLLVVSGLHVSLMAVVLAALLRAPAQAAYAARLIEPRRWRQLAATLDILAGVAALLYLAVTGSSAAAQRSALLFAIWRGSAVFVGTLSVTERLLIAASLQALLFPIGFVGEASLMSWAAYILVLAPLSSVARIPGVLVSQMALTILVAAVFGQLTLVGLGANLILIPAFPLLLSTGLLAMIFPGLPWVPLLLAIQRNFIGLVHLFDALCDRWTWLSIPSDELPTLWRMVAVGISGWILLNRCRDLTIRP